MSLKFKWSPKASFEYGEIIDYILLSFGEAATERFDRHVEEVLGLMFIFPKCILNRSRRKGYFGVY